MRQMKLFVTKVLIMSGGRIVYSLPYQHPGYFREKSIETTFSINIEISCLLNQKKIANSKLCFQCYNKVISIYTFPLAFS